MGDRDMTPAMKKALDWLTERGGSGVLTTRASVRVIAQGDQASFLADTWLRLVVAGRLVAENGRLRVVSS